MKRATTTPSIWQGAYIGINGGYGWSNSNFTEPEGGFGGGQIGYNWQRDRFVFGVEGDFQGGDIGGIKTTAFDNASSDINWFSTVRGRVGIATGPWLHLRHGRRRVCRHVDNRVDFDDGITLSEFPTLRPDMQSAAVLNGHSRKTGAPRPNIFTSASETTRFPVAANGPRQQRLSNGSRRPELQVLSLARI